MSRPVVTYSRTKTLLPNGTVVPTPGTSSSATAVSAAATSVPSHESDHCYGTRVRVAHEPPPAPTRRTTIEVVEGSNAFDGWEPITAEQIRADDAVAGPSSAPSFSLDETMAAMTRTFRNGHSEFSWRYYLAHKDPDKAYDPKFFTELWAEATQKRIENAIAGPVVYRKKLCMFRDIIRKRIAQEVADLEKIEGEIELVDKMLKNRDIKNPFK